LSDPASMPLPSRPTVPPPTARTSNTRHWVILFAGTLAIITYVDRVCVSQAVPSIRRDLGLDPVEMGYAFSAFAWAYALFEIPSGWLADWMGPRRVLMRVVVWWSVFTAATGSAWNLTSLLITRFLFGAGEAGCFPNLAKVFTTWLPKHERGRAVGLMWLSARWGGAFTPLLVVWMFNFMSWRRAFLVFGGLGIVWAILWHLWFRDDPAEHPGVSAAERELLREAVDNSSGGGAVPWAKLARSRTVWLLWLQYFCFSYGWYFYITWLPTYLQEGRGLALGKSAFLSGFPLFFGGIGSCLAGTFSMRLARRLRDTAKARRWLAYLGYTGAAVMSIVSMYTVDATSAMVSMGLASFLLDLSLPGSWGACMDVGGRCAGTLSGSMNMMGNIAGAVAPVVVGYILKYSNHNWAITFWISAAIYLLGAACWRWIDPVTPIDEASSRN